MRQLPHFPPEIPAEPLNLRLMYLLPNSGPREDVVVPLNLPGLETKPEITEAFLRKILPISRAHGVRIETEDGGFIRQWTVCDVIRERLGIEVFRAGDRDRAQRSLPDLPPL